MINAIHEDIMIATVVNQAGTKHFIFREIIAYIAKRAEQRCPNLAGLPICGRESEAGMMETKHTALCRSPIELRIQTAAGVACKLRLL